jgi:hypothetical protein
MSSAPADSAEASAEQAPETPDAPGQDNVISLDRFRKKT